MNGYQQCTRCVRLVAINFEKRIENFQRNLHVQHLKSDNIHTQLQKNLE